MDEIALIASGALFVAAGICAVYHGVVAWRIARFVRTVPTLRSGLDAPAPGADAPSLCVVIPAHNEEAVIGRLARSLLSQDYPSLRIVFALDRCTDSTRAELDRAVGGDARVEIVEVDSCPDDWAGKVHAAHAGVTRSAAAADADLLLFTDADTWYDPGAMRASVALLLKRELGMLSLLGGLTHDRWFEVVAQPATSAELMRRFPLDRLNRPDGNIRFANGQFMLFRRELYDEIGGHEAVRSDLLEDLAFARAARRSERFGRLGVLLAAGMMRCEMYRDWAAFRKGWKRIFTESDRRRVRRLRRHAVRQVVFNAAFPMLAAAALIAGAAALDGPMRWMLVAGGAAGVGAFGVSMLLSARSQGAPWWIALTFPAGALLSAQIQWEAAADLRRGRATEWGGRAYVREADHS